MCYCTQLGSTSVNQATVSHSLLFNFRIGTFGFCTFSDPEKTAQVEERVPAALPHKLA